MKFGVVGLIGAVIDIGLFNILNLGLFGTDAFVSGPLMAKVISVSVAIVFNWVGNRFWTFRAYRRKGVVLEFIEYGLVSFGGLVIATGCLWVSHYLLGFTSVLADNIAANVVGLALGTIFRFLLYRYWVWGVHRADGAHQAAGATKQRSVPVPAVIGAAAGADEAAAPGADGDRPSGDRS